MTPAERWAALPAERKEQLRARWRQVRSLPPEERARLRRVASRLLSLERGLPEELGAEERERLKGLDPAERREVVRDLVLSRAASEARSALRRLPPEVATRLDELSPEQRRQELTRARESRLGRLLDAMVDQPGRFGLDPELVEPLRGLDLEARKQSLLVLLRERVLERVDELGGDPDLSRERLEAMEPEAFARGLLRRLDGDPRVRGLLLGQEDRPARDVRAASAATGPIATDAPTCAACTPRSRSGPTTCCPRRGRATRTGAAMPSAGSALGCCACSRRTGSSPRRSWSVSGTHRTRRWCRSPAAWLRRTAGGDEGRGAGEAG